MKTGLLAIAAGAMLLAGCATQAPCDPCCAPKCGPCAPAPSCKGMACCKTPCAPACAPCGNSCKGE